MVQWRGLTHSINGGKLRCIECLEIVYLTNQRTFTVKSETLTKKKNPKQKHVPFRFYSYCFYSISVLHFRHLALWLRCLRTKPATSCLFWRGTASVDFFFFYLHKSHTTTLFFFFVVDCFVFFVCLIQVSQVLYTNLLIFCKYTFLAISCVKYKAILLLEWWRCLFTARVFHFLYATALSDWDLTEELRFIFYRKQHGQSCASYKLDHSR